MRKCDKCGQEVEPKNDALYLDAQREDISMVGALLAAINPSARHLLPVFNEAGEKICEGSPSRAQYLEGQPRDGRFGIYEAEAEEQYRKIFARMQSADFAKLTRSQD